MIDSAIKIVNRMSEKPGGRKLVKVEMIINRLTDMMMMISR